MRLSVNYARRARYRRPPALYVRVSDWLGPRLVTFGLVPREVVTLEVPGRRSGRPRRKPLVQVTCCGTPYLVALAGEAEWVRNVRAAGGLVTLAHRREVRPVRLVEVPAGERAPILRAYLRRARGTGPLGRSSTAQEARYAFGLRPDAGLDEFGRIAGWYPVFRVEAAPSDGPG